MKHKLLIALAVLGLCLVTGAITRDSAALAPPGGTIRITARDIEVARPLLTADWLAHAVLGAASTWDDDHV